MYVLIKYFFLRNISIASQRNSFSRKVDQGKITEGLHQVGKSTLAFSHRSQHGQATCIVFFSERLMFIEILSQSACRMQVRRELFPKEDRNSRISQRFLSCLDPLIDYFHFKKTEDEFAVCFVSMLHNSVPFVIRHSMYSQRLCC